MLHLSNVLPHTNDTPLGLYLFFFNCLLKRESIPEHYFYRCISVSEKKDGSALQEEASRGLTPTTGQAGQWPGRKTTIPHNGLVTVTMTAVWPDNCSGDAGCCGGEKHP